MNQKVKLWIWDFLVEALLMWSLTLRELRPCVLTFTVLFLIFQFVLKVSLGQSFSGKLINRLWSFWEEWLERVPILTLSGATFFVGISFSVIALYRHHALHTSLFDVGIFTNAIWNLTHGYGYVSSPKGGISLFADHQSFLFWIFAPIFKLFPSADTLLVLQSFGLAVGAIPLYFIGKQAMPEAMSVALSPSCMGKQLLNPSLLKADASDFPRASSEAHSLTGSFLETQSNLLESVLPEHLGKVASNQFQREGGFLALLPLVYWSYLPLRNANAFEFHPEVWMLPLFLAGIAGLQSLSKRYRIWGGLFFCLALAAKESAGPVGCGIGLAWLLGAGPVATRAFTRRLGLGAMLVGLLVFLFDFKVMPGLLGYSYSYTRLYSTELAGVGTGAGAGIGNLLFSLFSQALFHPLDFFARLFDSDRRRFLLAMLLPLGFLPILNPRALIASVPGFLMLFMTLGSDRIDIKYHYAIEPAVGLFWALAGVGSSLLPLWRNPKWRAAWLIFWACFGMHYFEFHRLSEFPITPHARWVRAEVLPCLTSNLPISVSDAWGAHLATRPWVSSLEHLYTSSHEQVACVIEDGLLEDFRIHPIDRARQIKALPQLGFHKIYECGSVRIFESEQGHTPQSSAIQSKGPCLTCTPECPVEEKSLSLFEAQ